MEKTFSKHKNFQKKVFKSDKKPKYKKFLHSFKFYLKKKKNYIYNTDTHIKSPKIIPIFHSILTIDDLGNIQISIHLHHHNHLT